LFRGRIKPTIVSHLPLKLNTSETVRDKVLVPKEHQYEMAYGLSNGHMIYDVKGQTSDPSTLRAQYLKNNWRCNLAIITNY